MKKKHSAEITEEMTDAIPSSVAEETDEYEGDDAYVDKSEPISEREAAIMFSARKKSGLRHYAQESLLLHIFRSILFAIVQAVRSGFFFRLLTNNDNIRKICGNSSIYGFFKSNRASLTLLRLRKGVNGQISQSRILSGRAELGATVLRMPIRSFCVFLLSTGITAIAMYYLNLYYIGLFPVADSQLLIGAVIAVVALLMLTFGGTLAELIRSSAFLRIIVLGFFGVTVKLNDETPLSVSYSKIAVLGIITGIFSLLFPLYMIIIVLAFLLCAVIILKSPESGVLLIILAVTFLPLYIVCALIIAVWLSFALKFFSGKRVIKYEYIDVFPAIMSLALLIGGIFSAGSAGVVTLLPFTMSSLYFLIICLIRDPVWTGRCRVTFTITAVIMSVYAVLRFLPQNPLGLRMEFIAASDIGDRAAIALESSGILSLLLVMIFFMQLSDFYARKGYAEKLGSFALCALFATVAILIMEARPAITFVLLGLIAITVVARGLRFLLPLSALFLIIMPLFGMPSVPDILGDAYGELSARIPQWRDSLNILTSLDGGIALFGFGIRPDAFSHFYTGNINDADPQNLYMHLLLSLGAPTAIFFAIVIFLLYKYCLSHGHKCSDKRTPSRLHTYGCLLSVGYTLLLGLTENTMYNYRCSAYFWMMLGFAALIQRYSTNDTAQDYENDYTLIPEI